MRLSLQTILLLRRAALAFVAALEAAALEGYGWTPRGHSKHEVDISAILDA
jgi:hypothetical protein